MLRAILHDWIHGACDARAEAHMQHGRRLEQQLAVTRTSLLEEANRLAQRCAELEARLKLRS